MMERWKKTTYMTAFYTFLIQCRPLEPFLSSYLTGPNVNIPLSEVADVNMLIKTYSDLIVSLLMLTTADFLLYKPNIIFLSICSCASYLLLTGSPSVALVRGVLSDETSLCFVLRKLSEQLLKLKIPKSTTDYVPNIVSSIGIGSSYSVHILAMCYLFAQLEDINQFLMGTGILSAAMQLGCVVGDLLGQVIVNFTGGSFTLLPYCNTFIMFVAVVWSSLLPSVKRKNDLLLAIVPDEKSWLLKDDKEKPTESYEKKHDKAVLGKEHHFLVIATRELWKNFKSSYSHPVVLKYCLWYFFGMAAYILVIANMNVLYTYVIEIPGNHDVLSNGLAESMVTLTGAVGAYLIGRMKVDWSSYGNLFTTLCSVLMGLLVMSCYFYNHLIFIYLTYILYGLVCHAYFVVIISEIAKHQTNQCYSLVLVFNYFGSLIIVNLITFILIQFNFMNITIPGRFLFIGGQYIVLGIVFLFISIIQSCRKETFY